tara:strand:- start:379 stop:906 length:528 start_codon:yes stop_codon:yes gene_type:complete
MNNPKATSILNEILTKLSAITSIEDSPASEQVDAVAEELSEVVVEEVLADAIAESPEVSEEVVEAATEGSEEVLSEKSEEAELSGAYVTEEAFATKVLDMEAKLAEMKSLIEVEMSSQKKQKEELSAQVEKLSAQPAAEAITHNPEAETEKQPVYNFGTQRAMSTLDRVFNRLNK